MNVAFVKLFLVSIIHTMLELLDIRRDILSHYSYTCSDERPLTLILIARYLSSNPVSNIRDFLLVS